MSQVPESKMSEMEALSSLMDGELDESTASRAFEQWRKDPQARANWHAYHLIGDVLRCEDLVSTGHRDAAFLSALRLRLGQEPVVLAPQAEKTQARAGWRRSWAAPAAVAAGFVAVAGALVVIQMSSGRDARPESLAAVPAGATVMASASASAGAIDSQAALLNGQLIRDVRLDEYLAAHKKFGGSSALGGPTGYLRSAVAVDGPAR